MAREREHNIEADETGGIASRVSRDEVVSLMIFHLIQCQSTLMVFVMVCKTKVLSLTFRVGEEA
jgi:hypothetical protein